MQTTSAPTSSEPSPWSRSDRALAVWLGVAGLLLLLVFAAGGAAGDDDPSDALFRYEFAVGSTLVYAILVAVTWVGAQGFADARRALGLRRFESRWIWITLGLTVLALVVSTALEPILHAGEEQGLAPERWQDDKAVAFAVNGAVVALLVPFAEELFFRGLGVRALGFLGQWVAIVATAAVFALAHGLLVGLPALGFFGLVLAWVRWRSRSVWPGFLAHALYNAVGIAVAAYVAMNPDEAPRALGLLPFPVT
jgi:uncharacterized protein